MHFDMRRIVPGQALHRYLHRAWAPKARLDDHQRLRVSGMDAATAVARDGGGRGVRLVAIRFRRDTVARFVFASAAAPGTERDWQHRESVYSFRRLARWETRTLKPWRIAIHDVAANETVESLVAQRFAPGVSAPRRTFRLLNDLPRGEPRVGDRVKLIVEE